MDGVSVVVCCHNSSARLLKTIEHLSNQQYGADMNCELIIVDNGSTDHTTEVAHQALKIFPFKGPHLIVDQPLKGLSHARTLGISTARYDIVIFCDDDNWLFPDYVERAYALLQANPRVGACGGQGIAEFEQPPGLKNWEKHQRSYAVGAPHPGQGIVEGNFLFGAGLALRKSVYLSILDLGLDQRLKDRTGKQLASGGDYELCVKLKMLGFDLYYDPMLKYFHYLPECRLNDTYLLKLNKAFGESHSINVFYDYALSHRVPSTRFYFLEICKTIYRILRSFLIRDPFDRKVERTYQSSKLYSLFRNRKTIYSLISNLRLFSVPATPQSNQLQRRIA